MWCIHENNHRDDLMFTFRDILKLMKPRDRNLRQNPWIKYSIQTLIKNTLIIHQLINNQISNSFIYTQTIHYFSYYIKHYYNSFRSFLKYLNARQRPKNNT